MHVKHVSGKCAHVNSTCRIFHFSSGIRPPSSRYYQQPVSHAFESSPYGRRCEFGNAFVSAVVSANNVGGSPVQTVEEWCIVNFYHLVDLPQPQEVGTWLHAHKTRQPASSSPTGSIKHTMPSLSFLMPHCDIALLSISNLATPILTLPACRGTPYMDRIERAGH